MFSTFLGGISSWLLLLKKSNQIPTRTENTPSLLIHSNLRLHDIMQSLVDALHCDKRISRAAALNIVPTSTTDISKTLSLVLPRLNLKEKLTGIAMRVPTPKVSVVDLVVNVGKKGIKIEQVKEAFENAAANGSLKGILEVSDHELVSMDFYRNSASAIVDNTLTTVIGDDMIKVVAWYDNEWAYRYFHSHFFYRVFQ